VVDPVVVGYPAAVLPVAIHVDVAVVYVVVIWSNVDILGAVADPVASIPVPLPSVPVPGSIDPHVAVAGRRCLLLVERLWRQAGNVVGLRGPHRHVATAVYGGASRVHGATRDKNTRGKCRECAQCERQLSRDHRTPPYSYRGLTDESPGDS
jgi:hypothetical protein